MNITPSAVKELREKTNAGMMDCKKALEHAKGNMEQAIEVLRKKGLAVAQQKASRQASEGILGNYYDESGKLGCLVEVNCETDFVVKTDDFQNFVSKLTGVIRQKPFENLEALLGTSFNGKDTVKESVTGLIAKIGENMQVKRFTRWETKTDAEKIGFYLHAGSKIGVLVLLTDPSGALTTDTAKEIAMHVAAMSPRYLKREEVPAEVVAKEKEIQSATLDFKKPPEIQEKILAGKLNKFYGETCLEEQVFVKDPEGKKSVKEWLKLKAPTAKIEKFVRLQVGA
ncbi:MAG: elongation factor Ts [Deltaproteobacteria bacterium]|nr:elongation factor Ts [Deltaproteobacteria bacterium]